MTNSVSANKPVMADYDFLPDFLDRMIDELIVREGGYIDHPDDRGGATHWGITQAVAREAGYQGAIRDLPRSLAEKIYRQQYWHQPNFDAVAEIAPLIARELLDTGVNMGPGIATGFLQRSLNALNRKQRDYGDLRIDRQIGPATLRALRIYCHKRAPEGEKVLLRALEALQGARYIRIAEQRPANEAFVYGWLAHRIGNG